MQEQCPRCGSTVPEYQMVSAELIQTAKETTGDSSLPDKMCISCYSLVAGNKAAGGVLYAQEKVKEQKRIMMWKSRVSLIKKARFYMNSKMFSDAAVAYEKYLRVLEVVFDVQKGALTPDLFRDHARTQELTVVASAYWDLLRIYDTSEKYGDRQNDAAKKLALFLRFTPIFPDVMRKAEAFQKSARNPTVVKQFIKSSAVQKGRCFIATSAFGSYAEPEVQFLCDFRDEVLLKSAPGRVFVKSYYALSPKIADQLDKMPFAKRPVRWALRRVIDLIPNK